MGCGLSSKRVSDSVLELHSSVLRSEAAVDAKVCMPGAIQEPHRETYAGAKTERISWRKGDLIGTGANGRVYLGLEEETGAIIAVKEMVFTGNAWFSRVNPHCRSCTDIAQARDRRANADARGN
mmetsp:Transcript_28195/g.87249  ORF Transcript_28195/g.87249 Transcript_28195/m.87249 type:complete len:124 (-) Transcript_28195:2037-2408(-)